MILWFKKKPFTPRLSNPNSDNTCIYVIDFFSESSVFHCFWFRLYLRFCRLSTPFSLTLLTHSPISSLFAFHNEWLNTNNHHTHLQPSGLLESLSGSINLIDLKYIYILSILSNVWITNLQSTHPFYSLPPFTPCITTNLLTKSILYEWKALYSSKNKFATNNELTQPSHETN